MIDSTLPQNGIRKALQYMPQLSWGLYHKTLRPYFTKLTHFLKNITIVSFFQHATSLLKYDQNYGPVKFHCTSPWPFYHLSCRFTFTTRDGEKTGVDTQTNIDVSLPPSLQPVATNSHSCILRGRDTFPPDEK